MTSTYLLRQLYEGFGIRCIQIFTDMETGFRSPKDHLQYKVENLRPIIEKCAKEQRPVVDASDPLVYYWTVPGEDSSCYLFGPAACQNLTPSQNLQISHRWFHKNEHILIPVISFFQGMHLAAMTATQLTGTEYEITDILMEGDVTSQVSGKELVNYQVSIYEEETVRMPYETELLWLSSIENGVEYKTDSDTNMMANVGKMVENNENKQLEYMAVTAVTLATRAAIRGGVSPVEAYRVSDLYLQKLAVTRDMVEMLQLQMNVQDTFRHMVLESKKDQQVDYIIERCKDYIARHLHTRFTITGMSHELGYHPGYLSKRFSQMTGRTIQQYIIRERLKAAANMLRFSEEKISRISEYLQFSSPSRFAEYFKKEYQMPPQEFAQKYKSDQFHSQN